MKLLNIQNKHGFTFIEVVCVMIIISIVSSIAMPAINNFHSAERCKAEASVLVSYIRLAKYTAMQDNCVNRLIFSPEGGAFKIQKYDPETESNELFDNIISIKSESAAGNQSDRYELEDWKTIADEDEVVFNSSVELEISSNLSSIHAIYFKPDGYLYCYNNTKINLLSEERILFKYGSSAVAVDINALGVISSEAIPNEENEEYFDDKHKEGSDTDTNYTND